MPTLKELVSFLKERQLKSSFRRKEDIIKYLSDIKWAFDFPWRPQQLEIIQTFLTLHTNSKKILASQGIFGAGKTCMILGMLNMGYWKDMFKMSEVCFCAFNVCIKNEIKKKIKSWGSKDSVNVRTFDSLIYEFCKHYEYPHLKLPNYKGKRLFIYNKCRQKELEPYTAYHKIKYLFVDECQDLEKPAFDVFKTFFPNACIVFVGDIFQSVQKEPRESLLWYVSQQIRDQVHYFYMKDTPRVPRKILSEIKTALKKSYPEYTQQIDEWHSSSPVEEAKITWIPFSNYGVLYKKMFEFLDTYPHEKSMILTFSSCITVKGALGDLARVRRIIQQKNINVNTNYKSMDKNMLFLSTANSSKGLEREYVFIMSTFPLEKAFINFSNDLTTNLVTVAISRTKKEVFVCVPTDFSKFSTAFIGYETCPKPIMTVEDDTPMDLLTFASMEHSVTELLRQSILEYDTRVFFKSFVKKTIQTDVILNDKPPPIPKSCLSSEEERSFVGVCIEVLMTSIWLNRYPETPSLKDIESNVYYSHCITRIKSLRKLYIYRKKVNSKMSSSSFPFFETIFIYTELFIAIQHKIFFYFTDSQKQDLFRYWKQYRSRVYSIRPEDSSKFKPQCNVKMPLLTGIADGICNEKQKHIYEIKASVKCDWKEDAFIQAFCYGVMLGQAWFQVDLVNLFKNKRFQYIVFIENVKEVRSKLLYDILIWNFSSYLAKSNLGNPKNLEDYLFVHYEWNILENKISEIVVIRMLSPTKFHIDFHTFDHVDTFQSYLSDFNHDKSQFVYCGQNGTEEQFRKECDIPKDITFITDLFTKEILFPMEDDRLEFLRNNIVFQTCCFITHWLESSII
jgi:hypothetical protein